MTRSKVISKLSQQLAQADHYTTNGRDDVWQLANEERREPHIRSVSTKVREGVPCQQEVEQSRRGLLFHNHNCRAMATIVLSH